MNYDYSSSIFSLDPNNFIHDISPIKVKSENNVLIYVLIILSICIFVILLVLLILWILVGVKKNKTNNSENKTTTQDINYGTYRNYYDEIPNIMEDVFTEKNCNDINVEWKNNTCYCAFPYYGDNCSKQFHAKNYTTFGNLENSNLLTYDSFVQSTTNNLTYNSTTKNIDKDSCTSLCDINDDCKAVKYDYLGKPGHYRCSVITSDIKIEGDNTRIYIDKDISSEILINIDRTHPIFLDKVIVYKGKKPLNYWVESDTNSKIKHIPINKLIELDFIPNKIINDNNLIGVWSNEPFNIDDFNLLRFSGNKNIYVDNGDDNLNLPTKLKYEDKLYVVYKKLKKLKNF